jgi:hypothetical protein
MWKKVGRNHNSRLIDLISGAQHFVAEAINFLRQVGAVWHVSHLVGEKGTRLKFFAVSHYALSSSPGTDCNLDLAGQNSATFGPEHD